MDKIDRKIINLLQKNARASLKELSKKMFILPAIAAASTNLSAAGLLLPPYQCQHGKINFHVKHLSSPTRTAPKTRILPLYPTNFNVIECNCVTGDYSEIMEVVFPSTTNLDDFINTIQQRFGKTSTQIVFSTSVDHRGVHLAAPRESADKEN